MFRYQSPANYYTASKNVIGDTNYYELANMLGNYGALALGGSLALLQLFSMFGVLVELNLFFWLMLAPVVGGLVSSGVGALMFQAYDKAYTVSQDSTHAQVATAPAVMSIIKMDMIGYTAASCSVMISLGLQYENWLYAQYKVLPEEAKSEYRTARKAWNYGEEVV